MVWYVPIIPVLSPEVYKGRLTKAYDGEKITYAVGIVFNPQSLKGRTERCVCFTNPSRGRNLYRTIGSVEISVGL